MLWGHGLHFSHVKDGQKSMHCIQNCTEVLISDTEQKMRLNQCETAFVLHPVTPQDEKVRATTLNMDLVVLPCLTSQVTDLSSDPNHQNGAWLGSRQAWTRDTASIFPSDCHHSHWLTDLRHDLWQSVNAFRLGPEATISNCQRNVSQSLFRA